MKLIHRFNKLAPENRPQDPSMDGTAPSLRDSGAWRRVSGHDAAGDQVDGRTGTLVHLRADHAGREGS